MEKLSLLQETKEEDENLIKELQKIEESFETKDTEKFIDGTSNLQSGIKKFNNPFSIFKKLQVGIPKAKSIVKDIKFEKSGTYKTSTPFIASITSDEDGKLWIIDNDQCIQQLEIKDAINTVNSYTIEGEIGEIRCLNRNKIYFTSSTQILCLTQKDKIKILKDFAPNKVSTIHVSRRKEIIVGMDLTETERSDDQPVLMTLDIDGKITQVYENQGRQLLTRDRVRCCTTLDDGTICYLDTTDNFWKDKTFGSVVRIDINGTIMWKYCGNTFINSEDQPFSPIEILTTESNNLIISDVFVSVLHILTSGGSVLTILELKSVGIKTPQVMTMDINKTLWIAWKEKGIQMLNDVTFSGF